MKDAPEHSNLHVEDVVAHIFERNVGPTQNG